MCSTPLLAAAARMLCRCPAAAAIVARFIIPGCAAAAARGKKAKCPAAAAAAAAAARCAGGYGNALAAGVDPGAGPVTVDRPGGPPATDDGFIGGSGPSIPDADELIAAAADTAVDRWSSAASDIRPAAELQPFDWLVPTP